jgi:hypothetical protein
MTPSSNREIAAELGRYIIQARQRIRALEAVLSECCPEGLRDSWHTRLKLAEQDTYSQEVSVAERRDMLQNIEAEIDESVLIRVLHSQFLRKGPINCLEDE